MSPKTAMTFRIQDELLEGLRQVKVRDGVPLTEQVERALRDWLAAKGVTVKAKPERRRAQTRRRS